MSAFSLLFIIFLFVFYRIHLNGKQRKIEENMLLVQELSDKLKRTNSDITVKDSYIDELLKQNSRPLNNYAIPTTNIKTHPGKRNTSTQKLSA